MNVIDYNPWPTTSPVVIVTTVDLTVCQCRSTGCGFCVTTLPQEDDPLVDHAAPIEEEKDA